MSHLSSPEARVPKALDIQHDTDPARDHGPAKHIPHIGHALLFFSLAWFTMVLCAILLLAARHVRLEDVAHGHAGLAVIAQAIAYILTLAISWLLFRKLWERPFSVGLQWNFLAVRRWWYWIIPIGVVLSGVAQYSLRFFAPPKGNPVGELMKTAAGAWWMTAFGVLLAPLAEEIAFRGFLLPALAVAYDWAVMERTPAGLQRWQSSTMNSRAALVFSAIFSSVPFALLHAGQVSHAWGALSLLYVVSLVLSTVRIRTHSVACSTLMHMTYNFTIFAAMFVMTGGYRHLDKLAK
jgi:hypothetical protein